MSVSNINGARPALAANATTGASAQPGGSLGKDTFLKLLVEQLKNQDPTAPQDGKEMAVQLAQFSQLETLQSIDAKIGALVGGATAGKTSSTGN